MVKTWVCGSHTRPGYTNSREKIASDVAATKAAGVGCFIYYQTSVMSKPGIRDFKTAYAGNVGGGTVAGQKEKALAIEKNYLPLIKMFKGKKWIFYPRALELPPMTDGNIFRLEDGSVMV